MRTIVQTATAQRQLIESAVRETTLARHGKRSRLEVVASKEEYGSLRGVDSRTPIPFVEDIE